MEFKLKKKEGEKTKPKTPNKTAPFPKQILIHILSHKKFWSSLIFLEETNSSICIH